MDWSWQYAWEVLPSLLQGLKINLLATLLASLLALVLGLVFAIAQRSPRGLVSRPTHGLVEFVRRTPLLVQIYFLFYVLPDAGILLPPLVAGVLALGLHNSAYISEVYRAGIEGVARGQWDAATALNLPKAYVWRRIVLPQAIPPMIPALGNYILHIFKETAILSTVTVLEMMNRAQIIGSGTYRYFEPMTMVGLIFLAICLPTAFLLRLLERRIEAWRGLAS